MNDIQQSETLRKQLDDLAVACRVLSMEGHEDGTQGHLSLRDPQQRGVWLKRTGVPLGEIRDADDFILIDFDGEQLAGSGRRHAEWSIHTEILKARADVNIVGHSHPHYATLFTALDVDFIPFVQDGYRVRGHKVARFEETSILIQGAEMGASLARSLGEHWAVFLRNHGITYCGENIADAAMTAIYLERACRAYFDIKATGMNFRVPSQEELDHHAGIFSSKWFIEDNWGYFVHKLKKLED